MTQCTQTPIGASGSSQISARLFAAGGTFDHCKAGESWQAPGWPEPHPAVIVSHPDRVANKPDVTVLICASRRTTREPEPNEVILDANDGLDWPTLCKCDLFYTIQKANLVNRRGTVSPERRRQIIATINRVNGWL